VKGGERMMRHLVTAGVALVGGFAGAALFAWSGLGAGQTDDATRAYLLANPEILPEAMQVLEQRSALARIEPLRGQIETPFPGAVLGNPQGSVTLVEFSDYACGFCRQSLADVRQLIAANSDLKVVVHEYPILSPQSADAARMALAAAQQGKYQAFHDAMFEAGPPTPEAIEAAAGRAGVDLARAKDAIAKGVFDNQLQSNLALGQQLGVSGTPSWIVGDTALQGAVGLQRIGDAIAAARES